MTLPIIRLGDPTSHGGKVVSASMRHTIHGVGIARVGDMVICPMPGHGANPIVEGGCNLSHWRKNGCITRSQNRLRLFSNIYFNDGHLRLTAIYINRKLKFVKRIILSSFY